MLSSNPKVSVISGVTSIVAGPEHRDAARKDVGVAEDVLDPRFLDAPLGHVIGDRLHRHADEDDAAAGADDVEQARRGLLVAGALEHDVGAPAVGLALHHVGEVLRPHVDAVTAPAPSFSAMSSFARRRR